MALWLDFLSNSEMVYFLIQLTSACTTYFQSNLLLPNISTLFTNTSIDVDIITSPTQYIKLTSGSDRPNGQLIYNFNNNTSININNNAASWIYFEGALGIQNGNDTSASFQIEIMVGPGANSGMNPVALTVSSSAYGSLNYFQNGWTSFAINTKDLQYGAQIKSIKFKSIDVSVLLIRSFSIQSIDCPIVRTQVVIQDFKNAAYYNSYSLTYLGESIILPGLYSEDTTGLSFRQSSNANNNAIARVQINPQCSLSAFNGISFSGNSLYLYSFRCRLINELFHQVWVYSYFNH